MPGILELGTIKQAVYEALGQRSDFVTGSNAMERVIELAQLRIARLKDFDELRVTKDFTYPYTGDKETDKTITLPTADRIRKLYSLRLTSDDRRIRLGWIPVQRWDSILPEPEYSGATYPQYYTMYGNKQIEVWPSPDKEYTGEIRYSKWPTEVSQLADTDKLDLENLDDAVIRLAISYAFSNFGDRERALEEFRIYRTMVGEAEMEDSSSFDEHMAAVRVSDPHGSFAGTAVDDPFTKSTT